MRHADHPRRDALRQRRAAPAAWPRSTAATSPTALQARLDEVDDDAEAVRRLGVEVAAGLCQELLDHGVSGLHLYSMNRSSSIREIYAELGW